MQVKKDLIDAILMANKFTSKRHTIPILRNIKIEIADGIATVIGTNQSDAAILSVPVEGEETLVFTVDGNRMCGVLENLRSVEGNTEMSLMGNDRLVIDSNGIKYTLSTIPCDQYPLVRWSGEVIAQFNGNDIVEGITACLPKIDDVSDKGANVIYIHLSKEKGLRFIATNRKIGIEVTYPVNYEEKVWDVRMSSDSARLLASISRNSSEVILEKSDGQDGVYGVRCGNDVFLFRKMEGEYLQWDATSERMKDSLEGVGFNISKKDIVTILERMKPIMDGLEHQGMVWDGKGDTVDISTEKSVGSYSESIKIDGTFNGIVMINYPILELLTKGLSDETMFNLELKPSPASKGEAMLPCGYTTKTERGTIWGFIAPMILKDN